MENPAQQFKGMNEAMAVAISMATAGFARVKNYGQFVFEEDNIVLALPESRCRTFDSVVRQVGKELFNEHLPMNMRRRFYDASQIIMQCCEAWEDANKVKPIRGSSNNG